MSEEEKQEPILPKRRIARPPLRGARKPKTGKHSRQGKDRPTAEKAVTRKGDIVTVGALAWNKDWSKRITDFEDLSNQMNDLYGKAGQLQGIEENLIAFEAEEKLKPRHKNYESAQGVFMAYAIAKQTPPDYVLENYGITMEHFKGWVCWKFVSILEGQPNDPKEETEAEE